MGFKEKTKKAAVIYIDMRQKKVIVIDNVLLNAVLLQFSANTGKAMEQAVFWELKSRKHANQSFSKNNSD